MKKILVIIQYTLSIISLNTHVGCLGNGHNIIWHMTHNARDSSHHNSWDNVNLVTSDTSNDYSSEASFAQQIQTQNWNDLAAQLQHFAKFGQFQATYKELTIDINYVGRLLQQAKPSDQASHIGNIIELVEFASGSGSTSFQKSVAELLVKLEPYLLDSSGNLRQSLSWRETWRYDGIVNEFSTKTNEWFGYFGAIECARSALGNSSSVDLSQSKLLSKYLNNAEIKSYIEMRKLLDKGDFYQAYSIVQKYSLQSSSPKQNYFFTRYQQEFNWKYNVQGVQKEYLTTPYYKKHLTALPASKVPSEFNAVIRDYLEKREQICGHTGALSSCTEGIVEKIIEIGHENTQALLDYFCQLSFDNPNPEMVKSFNELSNHFGAPKWLRYNKLTQEIKFNSAIKTAAYSAERKLVAQLGLMDCLNEFPRIEQALFCLNEACGPRSLTQTFGDYGRALAEHILVGKTLSFELPDFRQAVPELQQPIQEAVLVLFTDLILQATENSNVDPILAKNARHAYEGMVRGRKPETVYLQECLLPSPCYMALNLEMPLKVYSAIGMPQHIELCCEHISARVNACRDIEANGFIVARIDDRFTPKERISLIHERIDVHEIENFMGNQLERVDQHFRILDLKELARAKELKFHPAIAPLIEFAFKSDSVSKLYADYKLQGPAYAFGTLRSMTVASIKHMYAVDKQIAIGAAQGVWDGVKNVAYMAANLQQTLTQAAQGIDSLAQVLDHCLWRVNEFAIDVYKQPEKAKVDFVAFCESAIELNQEMRQKIYDKGFAECSRECAKFATETLLIGKLTDLALLGCNALEGQAKHLLDNYKGLMQDAECATAVTAEGIEIKLTQKAENCVFSDLENEGNRFSALHHETTPKDIRRISLTETVSYSKAEEAIAKYTDKFKELGLKPFSKDATKHIVNGHTIDGVKAQAKNKSIFYEGESFVDLAIEGWKRGTAINAKEKTYDCGRFIGLDINKNPTRTIKIVLNDTLDSFRTIFPY